MLGDGSMPLSTSAPHSRPAWKFRHAFKRRGRGPVLVLGGQTLRIAARPGANHEREQ